jgi:hypothetical protein
MTRPDPGPAGVDRRVFIVIVSIIAVGFLTGLGFLLFSVGLDWQ